jgi:purine-binding chemotaxis protein CheW
MSTNKQYCTFHLDGLFLGVEVHKVQEVIRFQQMTPVQLASPAIRGLINLRGQIVTAIDLRSRLELKLRSKTHLPMNVVVRTDDGPISLLVDEIGDVLEMTEEAFERPPETLGGIARELIVGAFKLKDRLLLALDVDKVVKFQGEAA